MALNLGIDLGGTKILAVVLDENLNVLSRAKEKVKKGVNPDVTAVQMKELSLEALSKINADIGDVENIGISIPSSVDPVTGEAFHSPALGWKNVPIRKIISDVFQKKIVIENDVNCGALAEHKTGSAKNFSNVVVYFVGTGLGGGIIINDKLYKGTRGLAGELGHETIVYGGRRCGCGKRGCVEAYCSKTAFAKRLAKFAAKDKKTRKKLSEYFGDDFSNISSSQLLQAWNDGNKVVTEIVKEGFEILGAAAANMVSILDPQCIVFGGGVVEAFGELVMDPINKSFRQNLFGAKPSDIYLAISALGDDAVPIGAAINAMESA